MINYLRSSVFALTVPLILPSLFNNLSCKIAMNPTCFTRIFRGRSGLPTVLTGGTRFYYSYVVSIQGRENGETNGIVV